MASLYQIADEYVEIFNHLKDEDFDMETIENTLSPIQKSFEEKAQNVASYISNVDADLEVLQAHKSNIQERIDSCKKEIEYYRNYIKTNMQKLHIKSLKCSFFDIMIKNANPKVEVDDELLIPETYVKTKMLTSLDKDRMRDDMKDGKNIPGAHLEEVQSITIKLK